MRSLSIVMTCCMLLTATVARADDLADQVKADPNNAEMLNKYLGEQFTSIGSQVGSDTDAAEKSLNELEAFLTDLEVTEADAKQLMTRADAAIRSYRGQIVLARTTVEEIVAKLTETPNDVEAWSQFQSKISSQVAPLARSAPDEAAKILSQARETISVLSEKADSDQAKQVLARVEQAFGRYDATIESGRKLLALIGQDAAEMTDITAFVNGEALTSADLKGKVVFLDFWAVWCGPCIATFPHLREWNEMYADKGLVIIGLTRYYNYQWNEEAGRAVRSQEAVSPEDENVMLAQFAESHDLHHVFAVQEDAALSEYYGVTGIPHAVIIDREGKIRMIKVGSGEQNAKDLAGMLEQLINE